MNKLLLVDGNSILNRAFYGLPDLTNQEGLHTNAVLGFINILQKITDEEKPTNVCVAFDVKHPTFRHEMYKEYKGTRKPMPDELRMQLPLIKEVLTSMNIKIVELPGFEADDILGTLSRIGSKAGYKIALLSGDRDLLQLATDDILVKIPKTKAGKTTVENYYAKDVEALYGVDPITFIELKALMGDTSDNIPGVPGIGEKTASKLLVEYGSLDNIYASLDSMKPSKMKTNLEENKDSAYLSKTLATIKLDVPIDIDLNETLYGNIYNTESYKMFKRLEFKNLLNKFSNDAKVNIESKIENDITDEDIDLSKFDIEIVNDINRFKEVINSIKSDNIIGFDVKFCEDGSTYVSICNGCGKVYIVNCFAEISSKFVADSILAKLNSGTRMVGQDIKALLPFLCENGDLTENVKINIYDASIAAYLINPLSSNYTYNDLANNYLGLILLDKKELIGNSSLNIFSYTDENVLKYLAYNSFVPYMIWNKLENILIKNEMYDLYRNIEMPCLYSLYTMEKNGIKIDKDGLKSYGEKLKSRICELKNEIYSYVGREFNINSTKQLGDILFEELGLKHGKKTKTGYSTSVDVLEKLSDEHPIIPAILEYRQLTKLDSTYVEGLGSCIAEDGRIHGTFNQTVTATGRISSTEPNLQNIPTRYPLGKEIRRVFIPEDGYVFLDADYSQIELRVLAHMSEDSILINAYNKDKDIHSITASEVFGVSLSDVNDLMRRKAKAVNFGIVYGISSFGLGQDLDISRKEAEGYIEKYFETYKGVKRFLDETVETAREKGYSVTMFGRRRPISELKSSNFMTRSFGERVAMNSPIQGTAADIIKLAMINVDKALKEGNYKSRLVLQVHDELIIETAVDEVEEVEKILVNEMADACKLSVPLVVDAHRGANWLEAK